MTAIAMEVAVTSARKAILELLSDGRWHVRIDIIEGLESRSLSQIDLAEALAELRDAGIIEVKRPRPQRRRYFRLSHGIESLSKDLR